MVSAVNEYDKGVRLSDIDIDWIEKWRVHMRSQGLSENTIKGRLKQLRCCFSEAGKRELIDKDPFVHIVIGNMVPKAGMNWLSMREIKKIEKLKLEGKEAAVRDLFLFSTVTGLRWGDLSTLEDAEVKNGVLRKVMHKTNHTVSIPLNTLFWGKGREIWDRYKPITRLSHAVKCNSTANRIIKDVAKKAGIDKPLSFHWARRSAASNLNLLGMSENEISQILGHTKSDVTRTFYIMSKEQALLKSSKKLFKSKETQTQDTVQELPSSSIQTTQPYPCGGGQEILQE
jgi:site-specific recombinase XerD